MPLLIALIVIPLIEIALFITVGDAIGLWPTILTVIATAVAGAALLRRQGVRAIRNLEREIAGGGDPTGPMAHGAILLVSGLLLLTPGFFTDTIGFVLLWPKARESLIEWARPQMRSYAAGAARRPQEQRRAGPDDAPIEAEYTDLTEDPPRRDAPGER